MTGVNSLWISYEAERLALQAQFLAVGGTLLSLIGFVLPWFSWSDSAQWWYNGWEMMANEGVGWILLIFIGYVLLLVSGIWLMQRGPAQTATVAVLALLVALATMVVVSLATADALNDVRSLDRPVWNIGLILLLAGHAATIFGAFAGWVLAVIRSLFIESDARS